MLHLSQFWVCVHSSHDLSDIHSHHCEFNWSCSPPREQLYESKMEEQQAELSALMAQRDRLLQQQAELQRLHDSLPSVSILRCFPFIEVPPTCSVFALPSQALWVGRVSYLLKPVAPAKGAPKWTNPTKRGIKPEIARTLCAIAQLLKMLLNRSPFKTLWKVSAFHHVHPHLLLFVWAHCVKLWMLIINSRELEWIHKKRLFHLLSVCCAPMMIWCTCGLSF